jgi:hypothetical protein
MDYTRNDRVILSPLIARRVLNKSVTWLAAPVISKALERKKALRDRPDRTVAEVATF